MEHIVFSKDLTKADRLLLQSLASDLKRHHHPEAANGSANGAPTKPQAQDGPCQDADDDAILDTLMGLNNPKDKRFEPTIMMGVDYDSFSTPSWLNSCIVQPYIRMAKSLVRVETDVVMVTHLLLYFLTSIPSAIVLFRHFTYLHGVLHFVMQFSYMGTYTLMMHQHIHMRGILNKNFWLFDSLFPYITDPLMGHTWNTYFYHHVKHHHVEGNGPHDLSSTLRYQRDNIFHLLHYIGRFFFLIWFDLPLYFLYDKRPTMAVKAFFWEMSSYATLYTFYRLNPRACFFVFLLPLLLLRLGLMIGNWGQHAFVDRDDPDSDYRSSITLIDVASNRHCFNDGYHTSHHLNPLRHWREHPVSFLKSKDTYASQQALVFHNIDYLMITVRLMLQDYDTLAKCMVPLGDQIPMTMEQRKALLKRCTQQFTEEEIQAKFKK
ncbi:hypothetical protein B0I35DRAFT_429061 [Stachybotrys elegans]|uniref:Fatty acid desaturase domain-containing protein n=1 Tax=Stachybotrys elegans TaxID=80388 RepID=A0A8K0SUS1_9HYPO|nr:hypothetical protein B0I35DRAFT_429061 [Stachybotrys elegans]